MKAIVMENKLRNQTDTFRARQLNYDQKLNMIYAKHSEHCSKYANKDRLVCAISNNSIELFIELTIE